MNHVVIGLGGRESQVLAHGTWNLEAPSLWLRLGSVVSGSISAMPSGGRPQLFFAAVRRPWKGSPRGEGAVTRAESHGYVDRAGKHPDLVFIKVQPLSLRAAQAEARFIEMEISTRAPRA